MTEKIIYTCERCGFSSDNKKSVENREKKHVDFHKLTILNAIYRRTDTFPESLEIHYTDKVQRYAKSGVAVDITDFERAIFQKELREELKKKS